MMNSSLFYNHNKPLNKRNQISNKTKLATPSKVKKDIGYGTAVPVYLNNGLTVRQTPTREQVQSLTNQHNKERKSLLANDSSKRSNPKGKSAHQIPLHNAQNIHFIDDSNQINQRFASKIPKNQRRLNNLHLPTQQKSCQPNDILNQLATFQYQQTFVLEDSIVAQSRCDMEEEFENKQNPSHIIPLDDIIMQLSPTPSNDKMETEQLLQVKLGVELCTPDSNSSNERIIPSSQRDFPPALVSSFTDEEVQKVLTRSNLMTEEVGEGKMRNPLLEKIRQMPLTILGDLNVSKSYSSSSKTTSNSVKGRHFKNRTHQLTAQRNTVSTQISESQRTPSPFDIESEENLSMVAKEIRETRSGLYTNSNERAHALNTVSAKNVDTFSRPSDKIEKGLFSQHFFENQSCEIDIINEEAKQCVFKDQKIDFDALTLRGNHDEIRALEEELANFDIEINSCGFDADTVNYLSALEKQCSPNPHYLSQLQPHLNATMRSVLLDWMMEVCAEFTLKRETYHYAVNYVDRYLSVKENIPKSEFQLIGVTALFVASKIEEIYPPKVSDFIRSCDDGYTAVEILAQENLLIQKLKWIMNPPTLGTWSNWYLSQWDLYIESAPFAINHPLVQKLDEPIQFRKPCEKSYSRFREINQLIDCAILDIESLQYNPRTLLAAFMYLILGKHYRQFTVKEIVEDFSQSSLFLMNSKIALNGLFGEFLHFSFGFELRDLLPSLQYAATFFRLPLNFDLPPVAKMNNQKVLEVTHLFIVILQLTVIIY